ncbi:MAG: hypothetical protein AB7Q17_11425 [Phycisphaerae bacterium]
MFRKSETPDSSARGGPGHPLVDERWRGVGVEIDVEEHEDDETLEVDEGAELEPDGFGHETGELARGPVDAARRREEDEEGEEEEEEEESEFEELEEEDADDDEDEFDDEEEVAGDDEFEDEADDDFGDDDDE